MSEYVIDFLIIVVVVMAITGVAEWVSHNIEDPLVREEIVRCRDCEHAWNDESGNLRCIGYLVAPWDYYNDEPSDGEIVPPDGFCAWGVREDGDMR